MKHIIEPHELMPEETYKILRDQMRQDMISYKKHRRIFVGPNVAMTFENKRTLLFQIQEMLYTEKGGAAQVLDEISAYAPLLPTGVDLVATMMLEYSPEDRPQALKNLEGIEKHVYFNVGGDVPIYGKPADPADQAQLKMRAGRTSSVHFLRFHFTPDQMVDFNDLKIPVLLGVNHTNYAHSFDLTPASRVALAEDFVRAA